MVRIFANDIFIADSFELKLIPPTTALTGSSSSCFLIWPVNPSTDVTFYFPSIQLPGLNQTSPHIYCYDETIGFLTFSIQTIPCLPQNTTILNQGSITFDTQLPVLTTVAKTITDEMIYRFHA